VVAGFRPVASAFTVWSLPGPVLCAPDATTVANAGSAATSQVTFTVGPTPEPGVASGVGVTRVHSRTASGRGSPDATPWAKTGSSAVAVVVGSAAAPRTTPAVAAPARSTDRRSKVCSMTFDPGRARGCDIQPFCVNIPCTVATYWE
jgi:hypothetical protein